MIPVAIQDHSNDEVLCWYIRVWNKDHTKLPEISSRCVNIIIATVGLVLIAYFIVIQIIVCLWSRVIENTAILQFLIAKNSL